MSLLPMSLFQMAKILSTFCAFVAMAFIFIFASMAMADTTAPADVEIKDLSVDKPLTGEAGSAESGREIFANRKQGNCLACHANSDMSDQLFHGEVGPTLDGVAGRWNEGQLRTILVNAKAVFTEQTVIFYTLEVGEDVREDLVGKTILTAQQIEDLVAYLATLK